MTENKFIDRLRSRLGVPLDKFKGTELLRERIYIFRQTSLGAVVFNRTSFVGLSLKAIRRICVKKLIDLGKDEGN